MPEEWIWDRTLFEGSARFYVRGRIPYADGLAQMLAAHLELDGRGRLLDVGCGPGVLTLPLAAYFDEVLGVDPDPGMLDEARQLAVRGTIVNARWLQVRAEELSLDMGTFQVATFGQSFHWMDQSHVASLVYTLLEPGGAFVHVSPAHDSDSGDDVAGDHPAVPIAAIQELVRNYLGADRRAGQGTLPSGTPGNEAVVLSEAGFVGPEVIRLPGRGVLLRGVDDVAAGLWSHSGTAPHLFGARIRAFETELRAILRAASSTNIFAEIQPDTVVSIWRKPDD